jgi:hypothetical protein
MKKCVCKVYILGILGVIIACPRQDNRQLVGNNHFKVAEKYGLAYKFIKMSTLYEFRYFR